MSDESLNKFTPSAQQVLALARKEAERLNHNHVGTEHLLLGLIKLGEGSAFSVLRTFGLTFEAVRLGVEKQVGPGHDLKMAGNIPYTLPLNEVLILASKEANALSHTYVGIEHILLALLRQEGGYVCDVFQNSGLDCEKVRTEVLKELGPNFVLAPKSGEEPKEGGTSPTREISSREVNSLCNALTLDVEGLPDVFASRVRCLKEDVVHYLVDTRDSFASDDARRLILVLMLLLKTAAPHRGLLVGCAAAMEKLEPNRETLLSFLQNKFAQTAPGSQEEFNIGYVLQVLTGSPVTRVVDYEELLRKQVVAPSPI